MVVGVCEIKLSIPDVLSLKEKRKIIKSITDRIKQKFNCSIAEVGDNDLLCTGLIGFSVVGNDSKFINSLINKILNSIEEFELAEIEDSKLEIIHL